MGSRRPQKQRQCYDKCPYDCMCSCTMSSAALHVRFSTASYIKVQRKGGSVAMLTAAACYRLEAAAKRCCGGRQGAPAGAVLAELAGCGLHHEVFGNRGHLILLTLLRVMQAHPCRCLNCLSFVTYPACLRLHQVHRTPAQSAE